MVGGWSLRRMAWRWPEIGPPSTCVAGTTADAARAVLAAWDAPDYHDLVAALEALRAARPVRAPGPCMRWPWRMLLRIGRCANRAGRGRQVASAMAVVGESRERFRGEPDRAPNAANPVPRPCNLALARVRACSSRPRLCLRRLSPVQMHHRRPMNSPRAKPSTPAAANAISGSPLTMPPTYSPA